MKQSYTYIPFVPEIERKRIVAEANNSTPQCGYTDNAGHNDREKLCFSIPQKSKDFCGYGENYPHFIYKDLEYKIIKDRRLEQ